MNFIKGFALCAEGWLQWPMLDPMIIKVSSFSLLEQHMNWMANTPYLARYKFLKIVFCWGDAITGDDYRKNTMQNTPVPNTLSKVKQKKCNLGLEWMLNWELLRKLQVRLPKRILQLVREAFKARTSGFQGLHHFSICI